MYGDNIYIFLNVTFGLFSFLFGYIIIERLDSKLNNHMDDVVRLTRPKLYDNINKTR